MSKYGDWTPDQIKALIDMVGGDEVARAVLRGERKLVVQPGYPSLVGTLVKTLHLKPYKVKSYEEFLELSKCKACRDPDYGNLFIAPEDELCLTEAVSVDLFQFDTSPGNNWVLKWAKDNGKKPIKPRHIYAIAIQHREELLLHDKTIVELRSNRRNCCLTSNSGQLSLSRIQLNESPVWNGDKTLFGFVSE